jgi:hypothetical protein
MYYSYRALAIADAYNKKSEKQMNTTEIENLVDQKVDRAIAKMSATIVSNVERLLTNEKNKLAHQTATGHGSLVKEPTKEDLIEFADEKMQVTTLEEIVQLQAQVTGVSEQRMIDDAVDAARRKEDARS